MGRSRDSLGRSPVKVIERLRQGSREVIAGIWRRVFHLTRFSAVGAAGVVVNQGLLWWSVSDVHMHYLPGAALATAGSAIFHFVWGESLLFLGRAEPGGTRP